MPAASASGGEHDLWRYGLAGRGGGAAGTELSYKGAVFAKSNGMRKLVPWYRRRSRLTREKPVAICEDTPSRCESVKALRLRRAPALAAAATLAEYYSMSSICEGLSSCEACASQTPPPGVDFGIRCAWCPQLQACRVYRRHSFDFPCADAIRKGGGFPGGNFCSNALMRSATLQSKPPKPIWGPAMTHAPESRAPVSIVIPSFARPSNIPFALAWLLQLEPLRRTGSEVLVSHGSAHSLQAMQRIDANYTRLCATAPPPGCASASAPRMVRHLDSIALNSEVYAAQRYVAGANATSSVLVHMDDDIVPSEAMLQVHAAAARTPAGATAAGGIAASRAKYQ